MTEVHQTGAEPGATTEAPQQDCDGTGTPPTDAPAPKRVEFGIDALGQWHVALRTHDGTVFGPAVEGIDFWAYPVDSPAAAVELQAELQRRFPEAVIVWKPGVMDSLDQQRAAAHRVLAGVAADRRAARTATAKAEKSLREALPLAVAAGMSPGEIAEHTGYARSTITKALDAAKAPASVPAPAAPVE